MVADRGGTAVGRVEYQRRPEVARQPVRLAPRPVFLAGREQLLADLDTRLSAGDGAGRGWWRCAGWAGRARPAWRWSTRTGTSPSWGWCGSSRREDPAALAAGFGELAAQLGVRDLLEAGDPVAAVHGVLAARPVGWLLIFDNAPDAAAVRAYAAARPGTGGC